VKDTNAALANPNIALTHNGLANEADVLQGRDVNAVTQTYITRYSRNKHALFMSLKKDLNRLGIHAHVHSKRFRLEFELAPIVLDSRAVVDLMRHESRRRLVDERQFLNRMAGASISRQFANGNILDISKIQPAIYFCNTRADNDLFRFCRLLQSVPSSKLLYRQIKAVVRDEGQPGNPIIGAFGLSSSVYVLSCRDKLLGWTKSRRARDAGLRSCMQLSLCIAVPPYSYLRAGKLIAALAACDAVADEYSRKYRSSELMSIITTSANGLHSPIYNRIMVQPGGLYKRIGETTGYSTLVFSKATLIAARRVVVDSDGCYSDNRTISTLKRALNLCGLPRERIVRLGVRKGVYMAFPNNSSDLIGKVTANSWPKESVVVRYWLDKVLSEVATRGDLIRKVKNVRSSALLLRLLSDSEQAHERLVLDRL